MSAPAPPPTAPDTKDWTWVTSQPCPDCGFDPARVSPEAVPGLVLDAAARFADALDRPDAADRPDPATWSVVEYGQHVADVCEVMRERVELILAGDGHEPVRFANWDQDATAQEKQYWRASADVTATLLRERAQAAAQAWARPEPRQLSWTALRSNGSQFTTQSLGTYFIHDLHHHLWDVGA